MQAPMSRTLNQLSTAVVMVRFVWIVLLSNGVVDMLRKGNEHDADEDEHVRVDLSSVSLPVAPAGRMLSKCCLMCCMMFSTTVGWIP